MNITSAIASGQVCCARYHYKDHLGGPWYRCRNCGGWWKDAGTGTVYVGRRDPRGRRGDRSE